MTKERWGRWEPLFRNRQRYGFEPFVISRAPSGGRQLAMGFGSWGSVLGVVFCAFWAGFGPALLKFILMAVTSTEVKT
jgi:hypothetical protein